MPAIKPIGKKLPSGKRFTVNGRQGMGDADRTREVSCETMNLRSHNGWPASRPLSMRVPEQGCRVVAERSGCTVT
jgi:hypothetical protein